MKAGTYTITRGFDYFSGSLHRGVDYAAPLRTPIYAAEAGVVVDSRTGVGGFGAWIVIDHKINGSKVSTVYGHMYGVDLLVAAKQTVLAGQQISRVGNNGDSTGPHLHFEVWPGGRLSGGTAVNPAPWTTGSISSDFPILSLGSTGPAVTKLQNFMTRVFPSYNTYTPGTAYGVQTEAGIKEFQRRTGLAVTGVVESTTLAMLKKYGFVV